MRRFIVVLAAVTTAAVACSPAVAAASGDPSPQSVTYLPPVDAPLTDPFRPPATDFGAGNRGVDYATEPGQPVAVAAAGEVVFAGRVGNGLHAVVLHADGVRTSYSFLGSVAVRRGERVAQGDTVGEAGTTGLHFGARAGEAYLDPLVLLGQRPGRVHLVADDERVPLAEAVERRRLIEALPRGLRDAVGTGAEWLRDRAREAVAQKVDLARVIVDGWVDLAIPLPAHLALVAARWDAEQATCTPAGTPVAVPVGRRIALLVGGLGSSTGVGDVLDVDTGALGYAAADVHRFSYRRDGLPYRAEDTLGDIGEAGGVLARHVAALQRRHPGAPVDVIAHSQGGLVARSAVTRYGATPTTLVTLGTPHGGTDLATAAAAADGTDSGHLLLEGAGTVRPFGVDPNSTAVLQMSETSSFLRDLREHGEWPPPEVTHVLSIGARGDPIVPSHQTRLRGAHNTIVSPGGAAGLADHGRLPGSGEARQEIARALARQAPSCRSLRDTLVDEVISRRTSDVHDTVGLTVTAGGLYVDARVRGAFKGLVRRPRTPRPADVRATLP